MLLLLLSNIGEPAACIAAISFEYVWWIGMEVTQEDRKMISLQEKLDI
jgi:hypothetical protein